MNIQDLKTAFKLKMKEDLLVFVCILKKNGINFWTKSLRRVLYTDRYTNEWKCTQNAQWLWLSQITIKSWTVKFVDRCFKRAFTLRSYTTAKNLIKSKKSVTASMIFEGRYPCHSPPLRQQGLARATPRRVEIHHPCLWGLASLHQLLEWLWGQSHHYRVHKVLQ